MDNNFDFYSDERPNARDILDEYGSKLERKIKTSGSKGESYSREYVTFKKEMAKEFNRYEKWCHSLGSIIKLKFSEKDEKKVKKFIDIAHLDVQPWQALGLGLTTFFFVFILGLFSSFGVVLIKGNISEFPILFFILITLLGVFLFYFFNGYPERLANKWRLKASSQMVPAILYVVVYMRHTSNFERAIEFAAENLDYPLSLDFKKVFYDVYVGKFSTLKESLDNYLDSWRDYSIEFIEAFHLIESSLFEPDSARRITSLEKSLQVVLDGVYNKMLKFTHNVRSPLTNVYMLGVVLPTLGLALLPLASAMLGGSIQAYHVFLIFNLIVPFFVFYLTDKIMLMRPGGYGETSLLERNPYYPYFKDNSYYFNSFLIMLPFILIGLLPLIFQFTPVPEMIGLKNDYTFSELGLGFLGDEKVFDFKIQGDSIKGPFGFGALICGMFLPLGIALFFAMSFKGKTKWLVLEREKTVQLEEEFNNSLFQLGNRVGNGVPVEKVFGIVAESSKGLMTEEFFRRVNYNIVQLGMSVEKAIFDQRRGVINRMPSDLIATSMRILIESSKKGLRVAATSLMSISEYLKNIQKINARLRDMLAEIISDMKSNMTFLAPLLSGIVVGLGVMITAILIKLETSFAELGDMGMGGFVNLGSVLEIFSVYEMIPPYYLQIIIGVYIIEIIFILSGTLVAINSGEDKLEKMNKTGKNLKSGILLYFIVAFLASTALFFLASVVLSGLF